MHSSAQTSVVMKLVMKTVVMMMVVVVVVPVVVVQGLDDSSFNLDISSKAADNSPAMDNWIKRLYDNKMQDYNKNARPVKDPSKPTTVTLGLSLKNIHLDDQKQEFSVNAWTIMTWKDEFLEWAPKNYMNIDRLHFDDDDIWIPDIKIYNSAEGSDAHPFGDVPVLADYKGQAFWFPPTHLTVKCDLSLLEWPRDAHECLVRMGSWAHHGEQIDIQILTHNDSHGVMTDTLEKNSRWELVNVNATRTLTTIEGHDPYVEVNFAFRVKRNSSTQAIYITQSTLAVVVVVLASYLLPLQRFLSRLIMHLFSLGVLIACFFTLFALLPATGGPTPVVVRYYAGTIILTTLSLLSTLFVTTRACCCCCCGASSSSSSSSSSLGKTLTPYNTLENELAAEEDEDDQRRPRAAQLNQADNGSSRTSRYARLQAADGGEGGEGKVDGVTHRQFLQVINFLLMTLFSIAFVVDYVVLRNVTL
ncbi:neuronal acetylcholine receptor subunit alpha-7-like isoform X2 [Eriocheir sinensis]|uniref:neuronal acetylcholine receptor subunit alpha-7-like isoform X2 n=1 Tax=Eriocheir sinensis TaxID=95602 RepID=UPI0021C646A2|nr:neuronal acetylcholine receptor subunit alpha-7-like isoform X2 [Eriocheir sinensis]